MAWRRSGPPGASALPVGACYLASLSGRLDEGILTDLLPGMAPRIRK